MPRIVAAFVLIFLACIATIQLFPRAHATTVTSYLTNYGDCSVAPLGYGWQNSGFNSAWYPWASYTSNSASSAGCNGVGYGGAQVTSDNYFPSPAYANVWFIDSFTVQNLGQDYSQLNITGTIFLLGWLGAVGHGTTYFNADSQLKVHFKVVDSTGRIKSDFAYTDLPSYGTPNPGEALCQNFSTGSLIVSCDSSVLQLSGDRSFAFQSDQKLVPGTYSLVLTVNATSSASALGVGFAQSSVCNTLSGWTNALGTACKSPNGSPSPYSGINCPNNAGTSSDGQCYFIQWKSTHYYIGNHFPADPSFSLSVTPSSFAVSTGPDTSSHVVTSTITITQVGAFYTGSNQIYVSARSETGKTYWYFTIPGKTGTFTGVGVVFNSGSGGLTNTFSLSMDPGQCNTYSDVMDVVAAFGSIIEKTSIFLSVTNNCSLTPQLGSSKLSAQLNCNSANTLACVAQTTMTVTNNGINWNQGDYLTARIENWTYVQNGQTIAQNCALSNLNCPYIAMNVTRTGTYSWYGWNPMSWNTLPAPGGSLDQPRDVPGQRGNGAGRLPVRYSILGKPHSNCDAERLHRVNYILGLQLVYCNDSIQPEMGRTGNFQRDRLQHLDKPINSEHPKFVNPVGPRHNR